jgi:predicted transcriptional regulator/rubrerythrin
MVSERRPQRLPKAKVEDLLPAVRAILVDDLVNRVGYSKTEAAAALNITPSAVTQYLQGKRARTWVKKIRSSQDLMRIVSTATDTISEDKRRGRAELSSARLLEAAQQISSFLRGITFRDATSAEGSPTASQLLSRMTEDQKISNYLRIIRKRIESEQRVALRNMALASQAEDELAKGLFRQIASDSMRHADILTSVASYLQKYEKGSSSTAIPSLDLLEEILKEEEGVVDPEIQQLKNIEDPVIKLFLESIEMDEQKHYSLLSKLLEVAKEQTLSSKKIK